MSVAADILITKDKYSVYVIDGDESAKETMSVDDILKENREAKDGI